MELFNVLKKLNLNEKEAKVYLAVLEIGRGSVGTIANRAEIKRPTAYLILEDLRKKGLISLIKGAEKIIYIAESPERLLEEQKKKEKLITDSMPELLAIFNTKREKPKVRFYEGKDRILDLYHNEIFKCKNFDIFCSIKSIHPEVLEGIWWFLDVIERKKIKVREIVENDEISLKYAKKYASDVHQIKILPKKLKIPTDNIIFKNKLAIFSYKDTPMVVVIESNDVSITYKNIFELLWKTVI